MANLFGPWDVAGAEHVTSDPVTFLFKGRLIYRTDTLELKVYSGTAWITIVGSSGQSAWTKYTVGFGDFSVASTTTDIELFALPALEIIEAVHIKHSASFTGGGASSCTLSVGSSSDHDRLLSAFDVFQAPSTSNWKSANTLDLVVQSTTSIRVEAIADVNLNTLVAGSADIWVKKALLP